MGAGGLAAVIAMGLEAADDAVAEEQRLVTYQAWEGVDGGFGKQRYAPAVTLQALVQIEPTTGRPAGATEPAILATVTFLRPLPHNPAPGRQTPGPIDTRDIITLADGTTGPIRELRGGMLNALTGRPFMTQVILGKR